MAVQEPKHYSIDEEFDWVGHKATAIVSGSFTTENITIQTFDGVDWVNTQYSFTAAGVLKPSLSPGVRARFSNVGTGTGSGLIISLADIPEHTGIGARKVTDWHPTSIFGLRLWMRADYGLTVVDGEAVPSWTSLEGGNRAFSQGTGTKQPILRANGINGRPALEFDGTDDILVNAAANVWASDNQGCVLYVAKFNSIASNQVIFASADETTPSRFINFGYRQIDNTFELAAKDGGVTDGVYGEAVLQQGQPYFVYNESNGSKYRMRALRQEQRLIVAIGQDQGRWFGGVTQRDNLSIGGLKRDTEGQFINGLISEIAVYSVPLTDAEIVEWETYVADRYGQVV